MSSWEGKDANGSVCQLVADYANRIGLPLVVGALFMLLAACQGAGVVSVPATAERCPGASYPASTEAASMSSRRGRYRIPGST